MFLCAYYYNNNTVTVDIIFTSVPVCLIMNMYVTKHNNIDIYAIAYMRPNQNFGQITMYRMGVGNCEIGQ